MSEIYKYSPKIHFLAGEDLFPSVPKLFRGSDDPFEPAEFVTQEQKLVPYFQDFAAPAENIDEGIVTAGDSNSITDDTKDWEIDEHKNLIVKHTCGDTGIICYGVVLSNTADTITFDADLLNPVQAGDTYEIIPTVVLEPGDTPTVIAFDVRLNQAGLLLPASLPENERKYVHAYIEKANNGEYKIPIMCRGADTQAGVKYGTLEHFSEGVRLYAHQWLAPHWDIINTYNIKRLASGYTAASEAVITTDWAYFGDDDNVTYDLKKRFEEVITEGKKWLRYTSLVQRDMIIKFRAIVSKTGAGGELDISIALKDGITGVVTNLDDRIASSRFAGGDGVQTLTVDVPIEHMKRNDEIIAIARRDTGTFNILAGSTILIQEF